MKRFFIFLTIIAFCFLVFSQYGKGYDDKTTHPGLTDEMVDFYNTSFNTKLTNEEKEWVVQGAIDEDIPPRWINHFYDPIYNEGWKAENLGTVSPSTLRFLSSVLFNINTEIVSSKQWVHDEFLQTQYANYGGNNTWENAIRQYANGNKKESYYILGHVLHLLEDKTVPDHTRNDTHAHEFSSVSKDGGSPYEDYGKNFNRQNLTTAQDLQQSGRQPVLFSSINDYFDYLANYSNWYFFSEHTINSPKYINPKIVKEKIYGGNLLLGYGKDKNGIEFPLVKIKETFNAESGSLLREYSVNEKYILENYFSRLTQEAVLSGAGVIRLFQDEAEKAVQDKASIPPAPQISWRQQMRSPLYGGIALYNNVAGFIQQTSSAIVGIFNNILTSFPPSLAFIGGIGSLQPAMIPQQQAPNISQVVSTAPTPATIVTVPQAQQLAQQLPPPKAPISQVTVPTANNDVPLLVDTTVPPTDSLFPLSQASHGSGSVTGVSPDALATNIQPIIEQVMTNAVFTDLVATSTDSVATTTDPFVAATSTDAIVGDTATSTDSMATSTESVIATSTEPVIVADNPAPIVSEIVYNDPVVINEVAWMGTKAQANDEWIELYNKTNHDIDLSGWALESNGKTFSVALSGTIAAHGYFLLERTATTTTDQLEHMTFTGSINNSGPEANLFLKNGATVIDSVDFSGSWPAGDNGKRYAMERVSAYAPSSLSFNWKSYGDPDATPFAKDAKGNDIFGTPGRKNSVSGYYTPTGNITENTTWRKEQSPYYVPPYMLQVQNGATLTIEPGVVVKFANGMPYGGGMDVRGVVHAEGTTADPIVFTSFSDDSADGMDSNRDNTATSPASADWVNINVYNAATPSLFSHVMVRYGGQGISKSNGTFGVHGSHPQITDSFFDKNNAAAIYADKGGHPMVTRTTIKNTVAPASMSAGMSGFGVRIADADSTADLIGNIFEDNSVGISSESAADIPFVVKDNVFARNQKNGEFNGYYYGTLNLENMNNQDSERKGGFYIKIVIRNGQTKTLHADAMPYIIENGIIVEEGGTLAIEPGTVIKNKNANNSGSFAAPFIVKGTLRAQGTTTQPIVFTAFADDSDGYDSDSVVAVPIPGAWENIQFIGAPSSDSVLEYVNIRYGGRESYMTHKGAVRIQDASPRISHGVLDQNLAIAMFIEGLSQPIVEYSDIRNTKEVATTSGVLTSGIGISIGPESQPILTDNTYANNTEDVVYRE